MRIETLVEDIYKVIEDGLDVSDEDIGTLGKSIAEIIKEKLKPKEETPQPNYLRPSNIGRKTRYLYYNLKDEKPFSPSPTLTMKFLYGDILEELLLFLVKASGHKVEGEQDTLEIDGVKGSRDCVIDGVTIDVKSASGFSFGKFKNNQLSKSDPFGYTGQLSFYKEADKTTDQDEAGFLVIDKSTGEICLSMLDEFDFMDVESKITEVREALEKKEAPIEKCYDPVEKGSNLVLDKQCEYCPYKFECWKDANNGEGLIGYKYASGIQHFVEVNKEPRVERVT